MNWFSRTQANVFLLLLLTVFSTRIDAACLTEPQSFSAEYDFLRNGDLLGSSTMLLQQTAGGAWKYKIKSEGEHGLAGFLGAGYTEISHWASDQGQIKPVEYYRHEEIAFSDEHYEIVFDWSEQTAHGIADGEEWTITDLPRGTVDRLLVNLKLAQDLSCGKNNLYYWVAEEGELEEWRFERKGTAQIKTALGTLETIKVAKLHSSPERKTLTWFVPEMEWLAARIEHVEDAGDERYTMILRSYEPLL